MTGIIRGFRMICASKARPSYVIVRHNCSEPSPTAPGPTSQIKGSHSYCINLVKKHDRENYLAILCIKSEHIKRAMFTLRAFNVELSLVRDTTTNSDRAKLRFLFWSKLVEEIIRRDKETDSSVDKLVAYYNYSPVAKELLDLFYRINLDHKLKSRLNDLIGSRLSSKVLGYKQFETVSELELYCSKSNASIYHLGWNAAIQLTNNWQLEESTLNVMNRISENQGIAHGLSNVIRGIPYNASKNCCYIPQDLLREHRLKQGDFTGSLNGSKIAPLVESLAKRCQRHLNLAYDDFSLLPNFFKQIFLPRVPIQVNLNRLRKCSYNVSSPLLAQKSGLLPLNLWLASKYFRAPIIAR